MLQTRREKDIIRDNRILREKQYDERRQKDYEEALDAEFRLAERAREEFKNRTALQLQQHLEILQRKAKEKHAKNSQMIRHLVGDIVELTLKIAEYQELNGSSDIPPKISRQWKTLLLNEQSLSKKVEVEIEEYPPLSIKPEIDSEILGAIDILDEEEFNDFLLGKNDWTLFGENK